MGLVTRLVAGGGIAAFFFFSWVIQMLWNSAIAGHFGLLPRLSYLDAAGLWLLFTLLTAWSGIGVGTPLALRLSGGGSLKGLGRRITTRMTSKLRSWIRGEPEVEWQNKGERMEERIRKRFSEWTKED
jgi:hypothetical protein